MSTEQLFENMSRVLGLFAAEHLNYPVRCSKSLNNVTMNGISHDTLKMTSSTGTLLLSFVVTKDRKIYNQPFSSINVKIHDTKHLPILNKLVTQCSNKSSDSFSFFVNKMIEKTAPLKLITSVEILPFQERTVSMLNGYPKIDHSVHAILTTPFEVIKVFKHPHFIFENDQFYLHDKFYFTSLGEKYTFVQKTECDADFTNNLAEEFGQQVYEDHYETITAKINDLYDIPYDEFGSWTAEQFENYYPVLAMERC